MTKSFPNLEKETDIHIQEAQRVPNMMNPRRPTASHIIIQMPKVKDKKRIIKVKNSYNLKPKIDWLGGSVGWNVILYTKRL